MLNLEKKQSAKVGVAGSFVNQMMSNNSSEPVVGKGATVMSYTDRSVYEVIEVSQDGLTVKIEELNVAWDPTKGGGIGHQNWIFTPSGYFKILTWKKDSWMQVSKEVVFTSKFKKEAAAKGWNYIGMSLRKHDPELLEKIYGGNVMPQNVVPDVTKERIVYTKIKIIFGVQDYYYDWSF